VNVHWNESSTSLIIRFGLQPRRLQNLHDFLCHFRRTWGVVFELICLWWEIIVVVQQPVFGAVRDCGTLLRPMRGDEDDGARCLGGAQAEELRNTVAKRVYDVLMVGVTQKWHRPAAMRDCNDGRACHFSVVTLKNSERNLSENGSEYMLIEGICK